ncbi:MAG: thioredoxin [Bacteroidota bacterium]
MKKFFGLLAVIIIGLSAQSQKDTTTAPYLRFPTFPPLKILEVDSATYFTKDKLKKNRPAMVMIFNPGCEHCQHETKELIANIDKFKKIQIVMTTPESFGKMKEFYNEYKLKDFANITVGRDEHFVLPSFYYIHNLPFLAFYDKNQKLISVHEGTFGIDKILEEFNK